MLRPASTPSARQTELLEAGYRYVLSHGLADLSLRPLATAIGSSPRVLLYLFGSKDGLIRELLARARVDELALLDALRHECGGQPAGLRAVGERIWYWLSAEERRALLTLWMEGYALSLVDPDGPWADFARTTVHDWMELLASAQPPDERSGSDAEAQRTLVLAVLRGALMDLLATGETDRVTRAVRHQLASMPD